MKPKLGRSIFVVTLSIFLFACSAQQDNQPANSTPDTATAQESEPADRVADRIADRILLNGRVYTFSWSPPSLEGEAAADAPLRDGRWHADASALVIADDKLLYVGSNEEALRYAGPDTELIKLNGATVIPGLIDSHVHIAELGETLSGINLIGVESVEDALTQLRAEVDGIANPNDWVLGQGWDEGAWANDYPDRQMLDEIFPHNPVVLKSLHGFAVWANSAALARAKINRAEQAPVGGEIRVDEAGEPTGILLNRATTLLLDAVPEPSDEQFRAFVRIGLERLAEDGYVAAHEAGAETRHMRALQNLAAHRQLPIRVYAMLSARDEALAEKWIAKGPQTDPDGWLDIRSVKAYYDGALGSRGARLIEDYADQPGHRGVSGDGYGFDADLVSRLIEAGFQVGIHAIGDAGNRETLDYLENVYASTPPARKLRHRIEHAQILHPEDIPRFAELDIIASMEPPHAVEDKTWAEDRLGADRIRGAYAWRSLRRANAHITFNSDLPGSDHSIFYGLHAAVTRRDKEALPAEGWYPEESLTMEETLRAYTQWAAFSAFREQQLGSLEVGKWADITVLDIDPMNLVIEQPEKLLDGNVLMTLVAGKVVFSRLPADTESAFGKQSD